MVTPFVSVVLTSFNHRQFIREAIDSVLGQSYSNFELIIWDDASSDDSWEVIQSYSDSRIFAFRNEKNKGPCFGVNKAILEIARGRYIAILHSDDAWELDKLEKQVAFLEEHPDKGAVFTWAKIINEQGVDQYRDWFNHPEKTKWQWLRQLFIGENNLNHPSVLIRKDCYETLGGYKEALLQVPDAEFWTRLLMKFDIHVIQERLTKHRHVSDGSNTSGASLSHSIRTENEWNVLRRVFFDSLSADEAVKVFPEFDKKYNLGSSCDARFILAQACLSVCNSPSAKVLGISVLYELISNPEFSPTLAELYGLTWREMATISAKTDSFSLRKNAEFDDLVKALSERDAQISTLNQEIAHRDSDILRLNQTLAERDTRMEEFLATRSWRLTKPLRDFGHLTRRIVRIVPAIARRLRAVSANMSQDFALPGSSKEGGALSGVKKKNVFDKDFYLKMYPDIAESGINPALHFRLYGQPEGRLGSLPDLALMGSYDSFDSKRDTILVVSHEASLTGAPILSLNLVQGLSARYNVVALLLGPGVIEAAFAAEGVVVAKAFLARTHPLLAELAIESLCRDSSFKFALVNSIESRAVLPALARRHIPSVSLIHEFAAYTRPKDAFREALYWSSEVVFSTKITLESAFCELPDLKGKVSHILPQGRCLLPKTGNNPERMAQDSRRILDAFNPPESDSKPFVILGAGSVQLRKGVDLFIECAQRVIHSVGGENCRFVWIGNGFDAERDNAYSVYLADQIRRSGLKNAICFLSETLAIDTAYEAANVLLLSSRLDPLPNVAIDALSHGLPVLCFDQTTGIAEVLAEEGLGESCVAGYLDTHDMAGKIIALATSSDLFKEVSARSRLVADRRFEMSSYISQLEDLALNACQHSEQERMDIQEVSQSRLLRMDFFPPKDWLGETHEELTRRYIRSWAAGVRCRKPMPGFHPGVYAAEHGLSVPQSDPFADYIRSGCPVGSWQQLVITPSPTKPDVRSILGEVKVALHLHIFYPELFENMLERLDLNEIKPDLFISVPNEAIRQSVVERLTHYRGKLAGIAVVPNRGRDIGPFLTAFGADFVKHYDIVGHLHTKVSADVTDSSMGKVWYHFLLENLLGGQGGAMADTIIEAMLRDPTIGLVFPDDPHVVDWEDNRSESEILARRLGIGSLPAHLNFPVGTMFWARVAKLRPLFDLNMRWDEYPAEPLPYDGTILHSIERILPFVGDGAHARCAVTNVPGLSR